MSSEVCEIHGLASNLKDALDTYKEQLSRIVYNERNELPIRGFEITDFKNSTTNYDGLEGKIKYIVEQAEKLTESLMQNFKGKNTSFGFGYVNNDYFDYDDSEKLSFKLCYVKPDLAPFEEKFITVNETAIKREIEKINEATKESCSRISTLLREIGKHTKRLKEAFISEQLMPVNDSAFYQFVREVQKCIGINCSFCKMRAGILYSEATRENRNTIVTIERL